MRRVAHVRPVLAGKATSALNRHLHSAVAVATAGVTVLALAGCSGGASAADDHTLRIAMGSPGEAQIRVWESVADEFEAANDGWKVDLNFQKDDLYQTIGLPNLLNGRNAPDLYFEWAGNRLLERDADGFAADLTPFIEDGPLTGVLDESQYGAVTVDGRVLMLPHIADVTNVLWYNTEILDTAGIEPPTTWDELLDACDALNEEGFIPIASGNKDLWAAGNWLAHLVSRVVGHEAYDQALSGEADFDTPEWQKAFGYVEDLAEHKCVNDSVNAIDDNEGAQLFFQGKAAMHAIGSWLVSWAIDEAPDLDFDFENLPAMPSEADPDSVIGVVTGYIVNAKSGDQKQEKAAEFLALLSSAENTQAFIDAEAVPVTATTSDSIDERTVRLNSLLSESEVVISPPDTGYELDVADAFYRSLSEVLGGRTTAADALTQLQDTLTK
ncbi:carbohydrate ABC transporter substrate-binding protein [Microbacterium sp. NEAU-LLC]|uniref:Carbohydrate ABC transporter substrate-binding protein n=1 Tax=Microbacterium helvum TaxID=2773713 RepID=A0ABR8NL53_9MICO|nr:carbohydrate ABC transporter substrate-binding protein [Microbacterium helvum]